MRPGRSVRTSLIALTLVAVAAGCTDRRSPLEPELSPEGASSLTLVGLIDATMSGVVQAVIGVDGGLLALGYGHSLVFPAGALAEETTIKAKVYRSSPRIKFGPEGLHFPEGHEPTLVFSLTGIAADLDPERLTIVYVDAEGEIAEVLPTQVDPVAGLAWTRVRHFSTYALATD
jgi:hypothetical protein